MADQHIDLDTPLSLPQTIFFSTKGNRHLVFAQDTGVCVVLNEAGREVLELLRLFPTPRQVIAGVMSRHSFSRARTEKLVSGFLSKMIGIGLLSARAEAPPTQDDLQRQRATHTLSCIYFHVTNRCNLSCGYCYNADYRCSASGDRELRDAEIRNCLDQIAALRAKQVIFTGGEPLLRSDILDLAEHARGLGLDTSLLTNGTLIRDRATRIAGLFDQVIISVDSWKAQEHERLRGRGTFERTVGGIRRLMDAGKTQVFLRPVITRHNVGSLPGFPRYAASVLGCRDFILALCTPSSIRAAKELNLLPDPEEYREALAGFHQALEEVGGTSNFESVPFESDGSCGAGTGVLSIAPNGDVFPCQCLHHAELRAGNIREHPLREIHRSSCLQRCERKQGRRFPVCRRCPISRLCPFNCWALDYSVEKDEEGFIDLLCPFAYMESEYRLWKEAERICAERRMGVSCSWPPGPATAPIVDATTVR